MIIWNNSQNQRWVTNPKDFQPFDDFDAFGDNRHAKGSADNAVGSRHWQVEDGGDDEPDAAATEGTDVAEHELLFWAYEHHRVEDALPDRRRHFGTYENWAEDLENGSQNACLLHGEDFGANTGAEGVGHVVCADTECQYEGDDEANDDEPEHLLHFNV